MVIKFCGWIDLTKGSAVLMNLNSCLIFSELLPFVYFHTQILSGAYLQTYTSYGYEISSVVTTWGKTGVSCDNLPLLFKGWFHLWSFYSAQNSFFFFVYMYIDLLKLKAYKLHVFENSDDYLSWRLF